MIRNLMNMSMIVLFTAFVYIAAGLSIGLRLFADSAQRRPPRALGMGLAIFGLTLHALLLFQEMASDQGLNLSFFNAASLCAWTISALLLGSALSKPVENLGILILPLTALTLVLNLRYPGIRMLAHDASPALNMHVMTSLLAYSLLTLASVQALLLAVQDKHLRHHHPGGFIRALPPLQTMESLLFEMIGLGFILLTLALISGFGYLDDMFAQHLAHKTILSIIAWIAFAVLLWGRYRFGWRGRTAIRWTLTGFAVLMLAYFGSKAVMELVLQR